MGADIGEGLSLPGVASDRLEASRDGHQVKHAIKTRAALRNVRVSLTVSITHDMASVTSAAGCQGRCRSPQQRRVKKRVEEETKRKNITSKHSEFSRIEPNSCLDSKIENHHARHCNTC